MVNQPHSNLRQPQTASEQPGPALEQPDPASEQLKLAWGVYGWTDGRVDRIPPCILQDIVPYQVRCPKSISNPNTSSNRSRVMHVSRFSFMMMHASSKKWGIVPYFCCPLPVPT